MREREEALEVRHAAHSLAVDWEAELAIGRRVFRQRHQSFEVVLDGRRPRARLQSQKRSVPIPVYRGAPGMGLGFSV